MKKLTLKFSRPLKVRVESLVIFCARILAKCMTSKLITQLELEKHGKVVRTATDLNSHEDIQVVISKI